MRSLTRFFLLPLLVAGAGSLPALAQTTPPSTPTAPEGTGRPANTTTVRPMVAAGADSLTASASEAYRRGALGRFFFGKHYRPAWQMPVTVAVFRPQKLHGGLRPLKEGGSMQTLNLRMVDPQGRQYVLRSVDKDLNRALPEDKRGGTTSQLLQDQTSAVHPYGALLAGELAQAAGVLHATPVLYRVPTDEEVLGEFQKDFAGRLVYLEERPAGDWHDSKLFNGSRNVTSSEVMLRNRYLGDRTTTGSPAVTDVNGLPARAYLRARLFDMYVGDWSRREDQWRWAWQAAENQTPRYYPIPRDRDHAFARYADGVFPALAVLFKREVTSFGPRIENVQRYVHTSEALDRVMLGWVSEDVFLAEADSLVKRLSDAAIDRALASWPTNVRRLDGKKFRANLLARRAQLPAKARELYRYLAQEVWLPGTDGPDTFILAGTNDNGLNITWEARPDTTGRSGTSTYGRIFRRTETKRICLYGLNSRDQLKLMANLPKDGPEVLFFDGPGEDVVTRTEGIDTPRWLQLRLSGDANEFDALPDWAKKQDKQTAAQDFDGAGFLLRHRLD